MDGGGWCRRRDFPRTGRQAIRQLRIQPLCGGLSGPDHRSRCRSGDLGDHRVAARGGSRGAGRDRTSEDQGGCDQDRAGRRRWYRGGGRADDRSGTVMSIAGGRWCPCGRWVGAQVHQAVPNPRSRHGHRVITTWPSPYVVAVRERTPPSTSVPCLLVVCSDVAERTVTRRHNAAPEPAKSRTNRHRLTPRAPI
jgi:hypothetical protein